MNSGAVVGRQCRFGADRSCATLLRELNSRPQDFGPSGLNPWRSDCCWWNAVESCLSGNVNGLILNAPPRSLKSMVASIALPVFALGRNPTGDLELPRPPA